MNFEECKKYYDLCKELAIRVLIYRNTNLQNERLYRFTLDSHTVLYLQWTGEDINVRITSDEIESTIFEIGNFHSSMNIFTKHYINVNYTEDRQSKKYSYVNSFDSELEEIEDYVDTFFTEGLCTEDEHFQLSLIHPELPDYKDIERAYHEFLTDQCLELQGYVIYIPFQATIPCIRKARRTLIHKLGI